MTNKVIKFSKAFVPCVIISAIIIALGFVGLALKGINFGIDYKPGLLEELRIAPNVMDVTYSGASNVTLNFANDRAEVVISGTGSENETRTFLFSENETLADFASSLNTIENVSAVVKSHETSSVRDLFVSAVVSNRLSQVPYHLYSSEKLSASIEDVRSALSDLQGVSVQQLGQVEDANFQVRMLDNGEESVALQNSILENLEQKFGKNNVAVVRQDFIGSSFSHSIAFQSIMVLIFSLVLIFAYSAFRFHWDFALGAVMALLHDALIVLTFMVWTQLEFSTMTVAAILTIIGYSINATIVILDRIRSLLPIISAK
ncbi:MAG: protein translocase subunit SecF, partial [Treponema sp.]|nr:protein translocase subunit SecF [Treponema sp.]